ncbi:unnamed protein product [Rotaria socialis]|nr:unnamed protein product [Rotaria socialis]
MLHRTYIEYAHWVPRKLSIVLILIIASIILITINVSAKRYNHESTNDDELPKSALLKETLNPLRSLLSPELQWCSSNPFLANFKPKVVMELEKKWLKWSRNQFSTAYDAMIEYIFVAQQVRDQIAKFAYPVSLPLPCFSEDGLKRYGTRDETGKILCAIDNLKHVDKCVIYSLGSNNQFDFESDLSAHTHCEIHTYDCTSFPPTKPIERLSFHKVCLGKQPQLQSHIFPNVQYYHHVEHKAFDKNFKSFQNILKENNHTQVHILKMDIEGGEYAVFADLFEPVNQIYMPYQITFESHWWNKDISHAIMHQQMFSQFWKLGYRFLQHEPNPQNRACIEWTLLRVFC